MSDTFLLTLARCMGFCFRAPGFSHPSVPAPVRAAFALGLALALTARATPSEQIRPEGLIFALAGETLLGAATGIAASILYDGAFSGGRALDDYIGIRTSVPDANVDSGAGFGRLWSLAFVAGFFVLHGDRIALLGFADTFTTLPAGSLVTTDGLRTFAVALPETLLRAALFVAGPAFAVALVAQWALASVARLVPRFSTFTLAFPVVFACVLLATLAAVPFALGATARPWWNLAPLRAQGR